MTFHDLPPDWPALPLTDPTLAADVLDLVVNDADRRRGALCVLFCRSDHRLAQPCVVGDLERLPRDQTPHDVLAPIVAALCDTDPDGSMVLGLARPRGLRITDDDREWHQAAIDLCRGRVRLLSAHRVTLDGVTQLPDDTALVSQAS